MLLDVTQVPGDAQGSSSPNNDERFALQQDNVRPHTSWATKKFFEEQELELLADWPANSPDLNPIENL